MKLAFTTKDLFYITVFSYTTSNNSHLFHENSFLALESFFLNCFFNLSANIPQTLIPHLLFQHSLKLPTKSINKFHTNSLETTLTSNTLFNVGVKSAVFISYFILMMHWRNLLFWDSIRINRRGFVSNTYVILHPKSRFV